MSRTQRMSFRMIAFVHETLYGLFRDPYPILDAAGLASGQSVLEVGCSPGFFTVPATEIVGDSGSLLALDVNPVAVEHVQRKIKASGLTNARVICADASRTDLPDHSFDLVFIFGLGHAAGGIDRI